MNKFPIAVCQVDTPEGVKDYFTCLPLEHVVTHGLQPEAIIGSLLRSLAPGEELVPEVFARNPIFVNFMHEMIARRAPALPGLIAEARRQGNGWVYLVDQRTRTPQGAVPPEDIIGAFQVKDGQVVPGSYYRSPNHRIFTSDGFFRLGAELEPCLLEELGMLSKRGATSGEAS